MPVEGVDASSDAPRQMTTAEMVAQQLEMHRKMQQQIEKQMEMTASIQQRSSLSSLSSGFSGLPRKPVVDPDENDNLFDMLDDLIDVAPERSSLSKGPVGGGAVDVDLMEEDPTSGRDSLADIMESLDMDLDDFELDSISDDGRASGTAGRHSDARSHSSHGSSSMGSHGRHSYADGERTSFDDDLDDLDDLDDFDDLDDLDDLDDEDITGVIDHGVDDEDDEDGGHGIVPANSPFAVTHDSSMADALEHQRQRLSSSDMVMSVSSSMSGFSQSSTGHYCTLVWEDGLLGLRLRMSQSRMLPAVSKLTGRSSIVGIHLVDVGDLLMEVGGRSTRELEFMDTIAFLKEVEKPCKLVFRRASADPMAVKLVQPPVRSALALKLSKKFDELMGEEAEDTSAGALVRMDEKYEIKWLDGPLGISLIASKDAPYPLVTRITGKNRSPQVQDVQPGHYLVQIGSYNTEGGNFNTAIKYLQKVSKPVSLFFCPGSEAVSPRPEAAEDEYDQVWEKKQPLCFTVKADEWERMVVADLGSAKSMKFKPKAANSGNGSVAAGDRIMWINDDCVVDLSFHDALLKLRTAKRPLIIRMKSGPLEPPTKAELEKTRAARAAAKALAAETAAEEVTAPKAVAAPKPVAPSPSKPVATAKPVAAAKPVATVKQGAPAKPVETPPVVATPVAPSRSFNPLKKIAALGAYAKENSMNVINQRNGDNKKSSSPSSNGVSSDGQSAKKAGAADNHAKNNHTGLSRVSLYPATTTGSGSNHAGPHSRGNEQHHSHHRSSADPSDAPRRSSDQMSSKIVNMEAHDSLRKPLVVKQSNDDPNAPRHRDHPVPSSHQSQPHSSLASPAHRQSRQGAESGSHHHHANDENRRFNSHGKERPDDYEVIWPEGTALGLTLRVHPTTRFPVVARVTGTSNMRNIENVTPGDILYAANGVAIIPQSKFKQTLDHLSKLPKPAVLRFRRAPPPPAPTAASPSGSSSTASTSPSTRGDDRDHLLARGPPLREYEYEHIWRESSNLGLVFTSDGDIARVTKVDVESGGPEVAKISVNDCLAGIGPIDITSSSFHSAMATLRAVKRPAVLRFHRGRPSPPP